MQTACSAKTITVFPEVIISEEVENHYRSLGYSWNLRLPVAHAFGIKVSSDSGYTDDETIQVRVHRINSDMHYFPHDINTWLSVVECFGLDAEYTPAFVRLASSHAEDICLYGFSRHTVRPRGGKYFRGRIIDRASFKKMFEEFFLKYGIMAVSR